MLAELERDPRRRWTDADLAAVGTRACQQSANSSGLRPEAVRRWFRRRFGMTFHGYARARRLAAAVGNLQRGAPVTDTAFDHGYESQVVMLLSGFNDAIRNLTGASPGAAGAAMLLAVAPVETPLGLMLLGAVDGNVEFFATAGTALAAGYRPCLRCRPLDPGGSAPEWLGSLLAELERDPRRRWTDADLATSGLRPEAVRRWFRRRFGMTFHGYARARRLAAAVGNLQRGAPVTDTA